METKEEELNLPIGFGVETVVDVRIAEGKRDWQPFLLWDIIHK